MKSILIKIILLASSIIISGLLIEITLRVFSIKPSIFQTKTSYVKLSENPVLGYELDSSVTGINTLGLKNKEIVIEKDPKTFRILVLGDSISFGCCEENIHPFPELLEKQLNELYPQRKFEVINAGVLGYNSVQEAEFFRTKLSKLEPDLIILQVTLNDWEPKNFEFFDLIHSLDSKNQSAVLEFYTIAEKFYSLFHHSLLAQNLLFSYSKIRYSQLTAQQNTDSSVLDIANTTVENFEQTKIFSEGFKLLSKSKSTAPVIATIFPNFEDVENYSEYYLKEHEFIKREAEGQRFTVLDLLPCFKKNYQEKDVDFKFTPQDNAQVDTVHPNQYGHEVAAQCILNQLQSDILASQSTLFLEN